MPANFKGSRREVRATTRWINRFNCCLICYGGKLKRPISNVQRQSGYAVIHVGRPIYCPFVVILGFVRGDMHRNPAKSYAKAS
jgi:hypothetical protein